jgi:hypothetical protein
MSDNEILRLFEETQGNFCGHFRNSQLNRLIVSTPAYTEKRLWQKFLAGVFLFAGVTSVSAQQAYPIEIPVEIRDSFASAGDSLKRSNPKGSTQRIIHGIVYHKYTGESLSGILIVIKGLNELDFTSSTGEFIIHIPDSVTDQSLTVIVYDGNYRTQRFRVKLSELPLRKDFALVPRKHPRYQYTEGTTDGFNTEAYIVGEYEGAVKKQKKDLRKRWRFWR